MGTLSYGATPDGLGRHAREVGGLAECFGGDQMGDCERQSIGELFRKVLHCVAFCRIFLVIVKLDRLAEPVSV